MSRMYFGGLPTELDVTALIERFGVPEEGQVIAYDDIEGVIKVRRDTSRFRSVTTAWRRRLRRERDVVMAAKDGAFVVLEPNGRIDLGSSWRRSNLRRERRTLLLVGSTDRSRLTDARRAEADHLVATSTTILQAARLSARREPPVLPAAVSAKPKSPNE